jgi:ABC-type transport system involved in cytochrome bd biosynthesis fused ATPase/permease subunit
MIFIFIFIIIIIFELGVLSCIFHVYLGRLMLLIILLIKKSECIRKYQFQEERRKVSCDVPNKCSLDVLLQKEDFSIVF